MKVKTYRRVTSLLGIVIVAVLPILFVSVASAKKEKHIGTVEEELVSGTVTSPADQGAQWSTDGEWRLQYIATAEQLDHPRGTEFRSAAPGPITLPGPTFVTSFIYGIGADGRLNWYRHDGASNGTGLETPGSWQGGRPVGRGWGEVAHVFPGGGNIIYVIIATER